MFLAEKDQSNPPISIVLCVIVLCCTFPLRTHFIVIVQRSLLVVAVVFHFT